MLSYPNIVVASITVTFWALKVVLSDEIATICHKILSTNPKTYAHSSATDPAASLALTSRAQRAENHHSEEMRRNIATDIVRSMPYCLNHTMGLLGPERAFFALRTALATLRRHPGPELEWCRAAHRRMNKSFGLRGAMQLHPYLYGSCGSQRACDSPLAPTDHASPLTTEPEIESGDEPIEDCPHAKKLGHWAGKLGAMVGYSIPEGSIRDS